MAYITPQVQEFNDVALPAGLTAAAVVAAIAQLQADWERLDRTAAEIAGISFADFVAGDEAAACSQLISRRIVTALDAGGVYRRETAQRFPDLWHVQTRTPLEVKANLYGRAVQGHNPETGWFLSFRYELNADRIPEMVEIRIGSLRSDQIRRDGKKAGSGRTETATLRMRDLAVWYRRPATAARRSAASVRLAA